MADILNAQSLSSYPNGVGAAVIWSLAAFELTAAASIMPSPPTPVYVIDPSHPSAGGVCFKFDIPCRSFWTGYADDSDLYPWLTPSSSRFMVNLTNCPASQSVSVYAGFQDVQTCLDSAADPGGGVFSGVTDPCTNFTGSSVAVPSDNMHTMGLVYPYGFETCPVGYAYDWRGVVNVRNLVLCSGNNCNAPPSPPPPSPPSSPPPSPPSPPPSPSPVSTGTIPCVDQTSCGTACCGSNNPTCVNVGSLSFSTINGANYCSLNSVSCSNCITTVYVSSVATLIGYSVATFGTLQAYQFKQAIANAFSISTYVAVTGVTNAVGRHLLLSSVAVAFTVTTTSADAATVTSFLSNVVGSGAVAAFVSAGLTSCTGVSVATPTSGSQQPSDVSAVLSNNLPAASTTSAGSFVHPAAGLLGAAMFAAYVV